MKMSTVESSSTTRSTGESPASALAAHTNADHAHHTSASTSIASPNRVHPTSSNSSVVTCVIANTNTRSHRSSTGELRRSDAVSPDAVSPDAVSPAAAGAVSVAALGATPGMIGGGRSAARAAASGGVLSASSVSSPTAQVSRPRTSARAPSSPRRAAPRLWAAARKPSHGSPSRSSRAGRFSTFQRWGAASRAVSSFACSGVATGPFGRARTEYGATEVWP